VLTVSCLLTWVCVVFLVHIGVCGDGDNLSFETATSREEGSGRVVRWIEYKHGSKGAHIIQV
jgi:hypothetical protein